MIVTGKGRRELCSIPSKVRLLKERIFVGQAKKGGRPLKITLPIGAIGEWDSVNVCFVFPNQKRGGWNPWISWLDFQDDGSFWVSV